ncbi:MAG: glucose-6-phosphate isomerase [Terriglobia bacterium]|nr:MAG: glucose-6-phosphate isomerase [Terriglobia bacterium]
MEIRFDEKNLLADLVGKANGVTRAEAERSQSRVLKALKSFRKKSEQGLYGFPHLPFQAAVIRSIEGYAAELSGSYDTVCVVGIGGSALGAWALDCGIRGPHPVQGAFTPQHPRLVILDNVDPSFTAQALASMDARSTLVVVIAKSGGTAETVGTFLIVREWLEQTLGRRKAVRRIAAVTTEGKGDLYALAQAEGYPRFAIPENVGGRFSVLSPVGLVPAALAGINIRKLARGAVAMTHFCWQPDIEQNLALKAALYHWLIWTRKNKTIHVAFPYSNHLWGTAFWFRQLWAESLGKTHDRNGKVVHTGQTPIAALGTTDQHSQVQLYIEGPNDKVLTFWAVNRFSAAGRIPSNRVGQPAFDALAGHSLTELIDAERRATAAALAAAERPNCTITLNRVDEEHLGAFLQMMEFETAFLGELLGIDAFDQPGVELGKNFTYGLIGRKGYEKYLREFQAYEKKRSAIR